MSIFSDFVLPIKYLVLECFQHIVHASNGISALIEKSLFFSIQTEVNDLFPTAFSNSNRNTKANVFLTIFAIQ